MTLLLALLILLGIADCVTTYIGLKREGVSEANPLAAWVFKLLGPVAGMLLTKALCTAGIVFVARQWPPVGCLFILGYAVVLFNNVRALMGKRTIF